MVNKYLSSTIIEIAEGFGIPTNLGQDEPVTDEAYLGFCEEYRQWALARDEALKRHLQETPTLFRVFLPYSQRVFALVHQVAWYLDEVVVRDPLERWVNDDGTPIHSRKANLIKDLQLMSHFRAHLDGGYLLLAGPPLLERPFDPSDESLSVVLQNPRLQEAFDDAVRYGLAERSDEQGNTLIRCMAELDSGGIFSFKGALPAGHHEIWRAGESYPEASREKVIPFLPDNWRAHLYPRELARILNSLETARAMQAAIMFDRRLPEKAIVELGQALPDDARQRASVVSFNVSLPYVAGVSPERLVEARDSIPDSFRVFRNKMYQIVKETSERDSGLSQEELSAEVESAVLPQLSELKADLEALALRRNLMGFGLPAVSTIGALVGGVLGLGPLAMVGLLATGAAGGLQQAVDASSQERRQRAHPFYFLWKVNRPGQSS